MLKNITNLDDLYSDMFQANGSFIVVDCKERLCNEMKEFAEKNGYKVQTLNLEDIVFPSRIRNMTYKYPEDKKIIYK